MKYGSLLGGALFWVALVRIVSGAIEALAGLYILRQGSLRVALRINAALGMVGPIALVMATVIGAAGLRSELKPLNLVLALAGMMMIVLATT